MLRGRSAPAGTLHFEFVHFSVDECPADVAVRDAPRMPRLLDGFTIDHNTAVMYFDAVFAVTVAQHKRLSHHRPHRESAVHGSAFTGEELDATAALEGTDA